MVTSTWPSIGEFPESGLAIRRLIGLVPDDDKPAVTEEASGGKSEVNFDRHLGEKQESG